MKKKKMNHLPTSGTNLGGGSCLESKKTLGRTEKKILIISSIAVLLTFIIGVSYAYIAYTTRQKGINVLETDCINVTMEELTNAINLRNAYPVTDEVGSQTKPFRFKLENTCGVGVDYNINLEIKESENRINAKNIAVKVDENAKKLLNSQEATPTINESDFVSIKSYTTYSGNIEPYSNVTHEIRIWLDKDAGNDSQNGTLYSKVVIEARQNQVVQYSEDILNGANPVLKDGLIPVEIDATGKVTKANLKNNWYSYAEKRWANAVILTGEDTYQPGDIIQEDNIESYFVWIPKYSYQLWDLGNYSSITGNSNKARNIQVKFGLSNTNDSVEGECTTPMTSGESGNCKIGDYMTPPAFISMGTNGLWVGKFETGYKGATTTAGAQVNSNDASKIQIKPNVYSWRNITVSNAFYSSYNYKRELDSHMMKNTEWGAVAYLQHSIYGSATSVMLNNNSAYITGYAAVSEPTTGYDAYKGYESTSLGIDGTNTINYKNPTSRLASTTGNYTGIYDMSGGSWEYMMGVRGNITAGSAGFSSSNAPDAKYYDVYNSNSTQTTFQYRILGDGTAEFGPFGNATYNNQTRQTSSWYGDEGWFVYSTSPWFLRGGDYGGGVGAGVFGFAPSTGGVSTYYGFRVVLAI